jgi:uncharacterized NAD(P)/FAD-binding protein YdhS
VPACVCVVGAGASGTIAAVHLLRAAERPLRLVLIDRSGTFGPGIPYRTEDRHHLLNVPAGRMSALAADGDHFVRWCGGSPDAFRPRGEYGRYLAETLREHEHRAAGVVTVERITGAVTRLAPSQDGVAIHLAGGGVLNAGAAILATGAGAADPVGHPFPAGADHYVADPWREGALDRLADGTPVLVLGTGLSMVDIAVTLTSAHPRTVVHAVSRHGLLPHPHPTGVPATSAPAPGPPGDLGSVRDLLRFARQRVAAGTQWHEFVDHLRPHTSALWQRLDDREKRRFLDRVNRFWDVHRHRAAPETDSRVRRLRAAGRLMVHRGRVGSARRVTGGYEVDLVSTPPRQRPIVAGWVVNATGFPGTPQDPLIGQLVADGIASHDAVGLGVATDGEGRLCSPDGVRRPVFTLGALRRGELFESTAIPEIRAQAAAIATTAVRVAEQEKVGIA